jgi:hypothetical protein
MLNAVVAVVVGGLDENQLESLIVMAPIDDAARRLGVELSGLFEDASQIVGYPAAANLVLGEDHPVSAPRGRSALRRLRLLRRDPDLGYPVKP